jgi:CubicO group peptidase (beta-lactamase class C family)
MRHTSGFVYGSLGPGTVNQQYVDDHVMDNNITIAEMVKRLGKIPLAHEPGSTFEYSLSVDVLGRVIEVVSKQPLDQYIEEHVARPLGMDTLKFHVLKDRQWAWSAINAGRDKTKDARTVVRTDPMFLMGGGGLYCTIEDYARFATMLLEGGELNGKRILSPSSIALMTHNHLGPNVVVPDYMRDLLQDIAPSPEMGQGFGLGFAVRLEEGRNPLPGGVGDYFWAGAGGTYFWNDPSHGFTALAWVPVPNGDLERKYRQYSRQLIYQAMERR